jgi:hypothetical protein
MILKVIFVIKKTTKKYQSIQSIQSNFKLSKNYEMR